MLVDWLHAAHNNVDNIGETDSGFGITLHLLTVEKSFRDSFAMGRKSIEKVSTGRIIDSSSMGEGSRDRLDRRYGTRRFPEWNTAVRIEPRRLGEELALPDIST